MHILQLRNTIQKYAWGSITAIPELLGELPDGDPQAELWMGAHPKSPSDAGIDGRWIPLTELIAQQPEEILGKTAARRFGNSLPFLFKVLAAAKPLSIQAHPTAHQAREGFLRETLSGIALEAEKRSYKDSCHKPECICALTPFWALNGFRKIGDIISYIRRLCPTTMPGTLTLLEDNQNALGLKRFFQRMMTLPPDEVPNIVKEAVNRAELLDDNDSVFRWILKLHDTYPQDIGVLSPAIMNLVFLQPGEAMYLSAGRLHAYFEGVGIELMANSDNVLRGGLTKKYVDVPELINVLSFDETVPEILIPIQQAPGVRTYRTPAEEFLLSEVSVSPAVSFISPGERNVEILLCVHGTANLHEVQSGMRICVTKGTSVIIPAKVNQYRIEGNALFYKASVGETQHKTLDI